MKRLSEIVSVWLSKRWKALLLLFISFAVWRVYLAAARSDHILITDLYDDGSFYWSLVTAGFVAVRFAHGAQPPARYWVTLILTFSLVLIVALVVTYHFSARGVGGIIGIFSAIVGALFYFPKRSLSSDCIAGHQAKLPPKQRLHRKQKR
jgi:hypothetical protein